MCVLPIGTETRAFGSKVMAAMVDLADAMVKKGNVSPNIIGAPLKKNPLRNEAEKFMEKDDDVAIGYQWLRTKLSSVRS